MKKLKVAILYYSSTGVNYQLAQWATEAAQSAETEVRRLKFRETAPQQAIEGNDAWKAFHNSEENK
ncbi:MAG TPA: NAD(P)H:quinone oxidoreductase, type IV, partial [Cryomorphaceae bacterium]|nr:NAD(P)H:quinone oxidoreductase, type IV [Cryomorphaceae bacterium]